MKKKVLYLITKSVIGGAQRYVIDLATNLPSNFEPVVVCGPGGELIGKLTEKDVRVITIPSLGRNVSFFKDLKSFFKIISILKKERPDILHLNSSKAAALGALAGRLAGVRKIIFTGHGWAFNERRDVFSKIIIAKIHWLTMLLSHTTIAVSRKTARDVSGFFFVQKKIHQVHNGIGDVEFLPVEEARKIISPDTKSGIWIGTISELHKNKGLDFMIKAIKRLSEASDWKFFIIGDGEEKKYLKELIHTNSLEERVVLCGQIPDTAKLLKAFDIFTLTSRTEAFPYALLEAGKAGLPVIASEVGGIPEVIENGKNGLLVSPGDIDAIASKLQDLIQNKGKRESLGSELNKKVSGEFSLQKMLDETMEIYND
jgi:glycosyltransferase involved in cell wall biosynthesis